MLDSLLHRACYAVQSIIDNRADAKIVVVAGSTRLLKPEEVPLVQDYAPGAETEYDLCVGAAELISKRYPKIEIVTVRKDNPKADNDQVIDETAARLSNRFGSNDRLRVAAVTTRIYVLGLELDMARAALRHNWRGFGAAGHCTDPEMVFNRTIAIYRSECITTLRKAAIAAAAGC